MAPEAEECFRMKLQNRTLDLPSATKASFDFPHATFFNNGDTTRQLPHPAEVRERSRNPNSPKPDPVKFEELGLIVKFGPNVSFTEAVSAWAIRNLLGGNILVPEVYGWRTYNDSVYLYTQLIYGDVVKDRWDSLSDSEQSHICKQLRDFVESMRALQQDPKDMFVGSINKFGLHDYVFQQYSEKGPFDSVKDFHDWFSFLWKKPFPQSHDLDDPYRDYLLDDSSIVFTHGDLHRANMLISSTGSPCLIGVVDWAHAGWYPEYWEYCKAAYTSHHDGQWRNRWIPKFLQTYDEEFLVFAEYIIWMGAV